MRRNLYSTWFLTAALFVASLFCATTASASHAVGADLTYVCLGNNTYRFNLTFYRDCSGIAAPTSFTATVANGCGIASQTFTLAQIGTCTDITPICATGASVCTGGTVPGVQQCTYSGVFTFPVSTCANWTISASECCRNTIATIPNSQSFDLFVQATLSVNPSVCNSSPDFTQPPVPYVCAGQSFTYNHGVIDLEGDSLNYQLVNPLDGPFPGTVINYGGGFSPLVPLSVVMPPGVIFNQFNGQMTFTPTTVGQTSVVAVQVREYRNGVLISTVRRDVQIIVLNCGANVTPQLGVVTNPTGATFTPVNNSGTFRICPGQTMSFSITATDANPAQVLQILSNAAVNFPGAIVNVTNGVGNSKTFNFTWTPTPASVGVRTLAIEVRDNNCPTYGFSVEGYTIVVQGVNAAANRGAFCYGSPTVVNLTAQAQEVAGGQYQWSASPPVPGLPVLPTNQNITVTITQQTTFTVRYQDNNCNASDTVVVQAYGPVSASPATVSGYCPTDPALQLTASYTNPAPAIPAACTLGNIAQCASSSQTNYTIGTGVTTTGTTSTAGVGTPFQGFWHDGRFQMLLTAAELTAAGVQPGLITRMQLNLTSKFSTAPYLNFSISMGCVSATALSVATGYIGGLSNVYSNVAGYSTFVGLNQFSFTTPYRWDGLSSLVIQICYDNTAFTGYDHVATTPTGAAQTVLYTRQDGSSGCILAAPTATNARPNIILRNCPVIVPPAGITYAWNVVAPANGSVSNAAIANPSATVTAGTPNGTVVRYIVTANDGRCTSKDTVIVNTSCIGCSVAAGIAPVVATNGLELTCTNLTRQLDAITPSLGDGTLTFAWAGPGITGSTTAGIITVNAPGTYTVTVTNTKTAPAATTCTATATIVVTRNNIPPAVTLTSDIATITCIDPSATLTATPNVPATQYTYAWTAGNGGSAVGFGISFTNQAFFGGTYTVTVTNSDNGCTASSTTAVTKNVAVPVPLLTQTGQTVTCTVPTVTLDISGSTPGGVDFLWSGSSVPPTPADVAPTYVVDASNTGTHTVIVRNSFNGCTATASATVGLDTAIAAMTLVAPVTFINCTTPSATLTATPLTAGQTYTWSPNTLPVPASNVATVTAAGTYIVTITNPASGCSRSRSVVITKNTTVPVVTLSASATQLTCTSNTITLSATPSAASTYVWSVQPAPVAGTNTATVGVAGTHTVTVTTTANGCTASSTVAITQISGLTNATITSTATVLTCTTLNSTLTAASTTPGATFTWSANAGSVATASVIVNAVGTYTVTVLNPANGCTAVASETITSNTTAPVLTLTAPVTHITCLATSASLTATLIAAHTYTWSPNTLPAPASNVATVTAAGTYTVTITNSANGCTSSSSIVITKDAVVPIVGLTASAPQLNCTVQTITLTTTPATLSTYVWSAGTTPDITNNTATITTAGNYTVTVTTAANGCTGTAALAMTQNIVAPTAPTIAATAPNLSCAVVSITLTASGSTPVATVSYTWPTVIGASTTVTLPGLYAVTATNSVNNCTALATRLISIDTIPPVMLLSANRTTITCTNPTATLTATLVANHLYNWSTNVASSTNNTATVNLGGIYPVTITNPANGCTRTRTITIIQDDAPPVAIIAPSTALALTLTCANTPIVLDASVSSPATGLTFAWSPASTGATKSVTTSGTYTVTATVTANGCTSSAQVIVTQDITPAAPIIAASAPELTCAVQTLALTATAGGTAYAWSGGTAGAAANVRDITAAGTYTVTMTSATNGCTGTISYIVTSNTTLPVIAISVPQVLSCTILTTTVTASTVGAATYAWSAGGTTPTADANTFNLPATYTVTVTSGTNGCVNSKTVAITQLLTNPTTAITGAAAPQLTCTTTSTTLNASGADTYVWDNTLITPSISVSNPGTYTVTGTLTSTGCTTTATFVVTRDNTNPIPVITPDFQTITCTNPTANLTVSGVGVNTLAWDNGTTVSSRAVIINGTYTVTATTAANGCTASASIIVAIDQTAPIVAIDPAAVLTCSQTAVNLNATSNAATTAYNWDNATTLNPRSVALIGTYTVTGTNTANGCTASATRTVIENVTVPTISIVGSSTSTTPDTVLTCTNTSIDLTPSGATNYAWDPLQVASQTATGVANVVNAGTYTVTATNIANGCTNTRAQIVLSNTTIPALALTTPFTNITCSRPTVTSSASGADDYVWSNSVITNAITVSAPTQNAVGSTTYTVIGTSTSNGCTASLSVLITYDNQLPTPTLSSSNPNPQNVDESILNCTVTAVTVVAVGLGNDSFVWGGTGAFTSSTNSVTTSAPGTYTVTATSAVNGCTATASHIVTQNIVAPIVTIATPPVITCATAIVTLTAQTTPGPQQADTYVWTAANPANITSQIGTTANVQATGVYTVVGTSGVNNCTASASVTVTDNLIPPTPAIQPSGVLNCTSTSIMLTATGGDTYLWSANAQTAVTPSVTVASGDTYTVTVRNAGNGCTASASFLVAQDTLRPVLTLVSDFATITCSNPLAILTVTPNTPGFTFAWTGGISTNNTAPINAGAIYVVTVTNTANTCQATATIVIAQDNNPPSPVITASFPQLNCSVQSLDLAVGDTGIRTYSSLVWTGGSTNNPLTVSSPQIYTVTVTDAINGCPATATLNVTQSTTPPIITITTVNPRISCRDSVISLSATALPSSISGGNFTWSNGDGGYTTTTPIRVTNPAVYNVQVTNPLNGCSASQSITIVRDTISPPIAINPPAVLTCATTTVLLSAVGGDTYNWSPPATTTAGLGATSQAGIYTVTATFNGNGCTASRTVTVAQDIVPPTPSIASDITELTCTALLANLTASPSSGNNYVWAGTATAVGNTATATVSTTYTVVATQNSNGCSASAEIFIPRNVVAPGVQAFASQPVLNCVILTSDLGVGGNGDTFVWSPNSSSAIPYTISAAGTYTVTATRATNGCTNTASVTVTRNITPPVPTVTGITAISCNAPTATLTAGGGGTYVWSPVVVQSGSIAVVDRSANYTVTVTQNSNGCTASIIAFVPDDTEAPTVSVAQPNILRCNLQSVPLVAAPGLSAYNWVDATNTTIGTASTIAVSDPGTYTVYGTGANGCSASALVTVLADRVIPTGTLAAATNVLNCITTSTALVASGGDIYAWTTNAASVTGPNAIANGPGVYRVTVTTTSNGCASISTVVITRDNVAQTPIITANHPILTCIDRTIDLTVSGAGPFTWSNNVAVTGQQIVTVNQPDTYTVMATTPSNGCTAVTTYTVQQDITEPAPSIIASAPILNCSTPALVLTASIPAGASNVAYRWNDVLNTSVNTLLVNTPSLYEVTATQSSNGCTAVAQQLVLQDIGLPIVTITNSNVLTCALPTTVLTSSTVNSGDTFVWSGSLGNSPSVTVDVAATYTVTVTSVANGCTNVETVVVTEDKIAPVPNLIASTGTITCSVPTVTISANGGDTYLWAPSGDITSTITVATGGTYTVQATSTSNGCTANTSIVILENTTLPNVQVTSNNPSITCANRRAILTATGADIYAWSAVTSSNGAIANVDAAGTYSVTGTETSNGCTAIASVSIGSDLANPVATILPAATLTCATQSVVLTATGGGNYNWSSNTNSASGANATVTIQGNYTVTVTTPSNGCTAIAIITVGRNIVPPAPVISVDGQLTCANPIRTLTATSGNSFPNNYAWSTNVNSTSDSTATALSLGIYTVTITRANNGCTASSVIAVTQDISVPPVSVTTNNTTLTCASPTAVLTANGGNSFAWSINVDLPLNNVANASASGIYTVTSTQASNGCTASATVTINQDIAIPSLSATVTNVGCNAALTGAIDLTVANSVGTIYLWSNAARTEDLSALPIGTYTCTVTGGNGCTTSISVIIQQNSPVSATFDVFNVRCNGGNTGRILTIPTGGTDPYSYAASNGTFVGDILNLVANTYTVTITDARGCIGTASTIVSEPTVLAPIATQVSAPLCNGQTNGQAVVNIVGGTQPYYAHWDSQEDSTTAIRLGVGVHIVTVTDGNQCSKTASVTISEPAVIAVSITNTIGTKCNGSQDGIMTATITGGTAVGTGAGFSTIWTGDNVYYPGVTPTNASLGAGTYYVTASDINGCTATASGTITQPTVVTASVTGQTPATCVLSADARATGVAFGGTPAQPGTIYSYRWDSGETSNPAVQLIRGTHTVTASDGNGCTATAQFFVEGPDAISLNAQSITNVTCFGLSNGKVTIQVVGGTPSYLYTWDNGQTTANVTSLPAGVHTVSVTDANGCTLTPVTFNISQPALLTVTSMTPQNPACNAGNTGRISVTATGGTVPYSYNWSNNGFGQPVINLTAGDYIVTVSDAKQCTATGTATIGEPTAVVATVSKTDAICYGEKTGRIQVDADPVFGGGTPPYVYSLDGISYSPTNYFINVPAGTYTAHIQDAVGCELALPVEVTSNPQMLLNAGEDVSINLGQSVQLQGSTASTSYTTVWTPAATLSNATILTPSATPTETTRYSVAITDADGCQISDNVVVTVLTDRHIYVPTIFTPNGDGTNDFFGVFGGVDVTRVKLFQVFDRWGELVYEGKDFQPNDSRFAWDGYFQGALLNSSVLVYYIQVEFKDGKTEEFKGDVTLMK